MRAVEKKKINKNLLQLIILGSMLVLLIGALLVVKLVIPAADSGSTDGGTTVEIREDLGETTYAGVPLAYSRVEEKYMDYILVRNYDEDGKVRMFDLASLSDGSFILGYSRDGTYDTLTPYLPNIIGAEGDFDLTSLYAIEQNDSYGRIYLLTYLCTALGTVYFNERIPLPEVPEDETDLNYADLKTERDGMLERFGLDDQSLVYVYFKYKDTDGTVKEHEIAIGSRALSGSGFYFMVDDRNYVYYTNSNYFDYALRGFEEFVNGRLVAEGLEDDYSFEPYLTTDFRHWINTEHKKEGDKILAGSTVITTGSVAMPFTAGSDYKPEGEFDGYIVEGGEFKFAPDALSDHSDYARFSKLLTGKAVGKYDTPLYLTLIDELGSSSGGLITLGEGESLTYTYNIKAIEAVITATDEIRNSAALSAAGSYNLVKVTYDYYVGGEKKNEYDAHAVLDLSNALIPTETVDAIRAAGIGEADISFEVVYTPENAPSATESLYINAITGIYAQDGEPQSKVTETSYVTFVYYEVINGHKTSTRSITIDLSANDESERWGELKGKLVGKTIGGDLDIKLYEKKYNYELMQGFTEYRISEIKSFITSELNASFRYKNKTEMDPFYGESIYENTMAELGYGQYTIYGIDSTVCQSVVSVLGGVGGEDSSTSSLGYTAETVALGLTHDVMSKYGLYAHTVYFELPRKIYDPEDLTPSTEENTSESLSDLATYSWFDTLGFTLYISEEKDGYRYVGSDMYDLVARVPAEDFSFLDYSFTELWARKQFLYMDVNNVKEINFDFSMKDYYGSYGFDITKQTIYVATTSEGGIGISYTPVEGATAATRLIVDVTSSSDAMSTEYERVKDEKGLESLSLTALYNELHNGGKDYYSSYTDSYGTFYYKGVFEMLLRTSYLDRNLTDAEVASALSRERLMSMSVKVLENDGSIRAGYYAYDFYYVDDSRVMVSAYRTDNSGNVTSEKLADFAITRYAFENIVVGVFGLLNGEILDDDGGYLDKN